MLIWEEKNTLEWLPSQIVKLLEFPRFLVAPYPGRNERIPDSASSDMNSSGPPVTQLPGSLTNANHIMEDWNDLAPTPADATSLRVGLLHNANNNAASGPWRTLKSPSLSSSASHSKLSYLERVVLEIVESERMYVRDLRSIVENYLGKIIDMQELLLRPEQVSALFGNIEDIYELNSELLQDLDSCHNDPVAVARCFVDRSQDFDIYTQYCNNYPNSVAALTECMRNKQLAKFFRERQEQIRHSLPLGSYLLKPVQRILKYHLLLQEIAKHFDIEEDGYEVVEEAIDTMTCVAWYINDMKRKHEHAVRLQEIQSLLINWKGPDLTTYGELVLEGTFRVHRVKNERTFFLFDKILLITKKRSDHYIYKSHIPCSSLMLIESTRDSLCFTVTHYKHNKQQYNIQAKSGEEKRVWTHHIKRLILENHHAIIPQKAKQAILEMDSYYPARYKYSPERMKKSWSCQPTEDIPQHARQGRRQSEPTKQILKQLNNKANLAIGLKSKNHKAQEGSKQCQSPARGEKNRVMETVSSVPKAQSAMELNRMMEVSSHKEHPEESHSDPEPVGTLEPVLERQHENQGQSLDHLEPTGHIEEMKPLSSEEEEEDEEEEEEDGRAAQSRSILPFSVLDQASIIAERFASSLSRRSSLALEEGKGYLTPKLTSRSNSVLSLEGSEKATCRNNSSNCAAATDSQGYLPLQEPSVEFSNACSGAASPGLIEPDRGSSCRRKEFMLSQQDRQLLDKIKSYYDYAEHQDAGFSVRRRESLSYIPKGLVRNSVFRINSLPQPEPEQEVLKRKQPGPLGSSSGAGRTAAWVLSNRPAVGSHAPHSEMRHDERSAPITEAEFRPPAEMIKVWEAMEKPRREEHWTRRGEDVTRLGKANGQVTGGTSVRHTEPCLRGRLRRQENGLDLHEPLLILEDEDLGAITEESAVPSPESKSPVEQALPSRLPWKLMQELEGCEQDRGLSRLHPRIMQLAHLTEAELAEKVKNKVYQLARQYSLRIKGHKPTVHRRLAEMEEEMKSNALADQQEADKKAKGKQRPVLTLNYEQVLLQEASPLSLLSSASPHENKSPKRFSYSPCSSSPHLTSPTSTLSRSPLSPTVAEKFHWPDVRELRSKYSCQAGSEKSRPLPVNRSRSAPEKMMDTDRVQGNHQCSKKNMKTSMKSQQGVIQSNRREASHHSIPKDQALDAQKEFCVTAEASLENSQRVIVMEKLPDVTVEPDESYVQIRSPTSREKISLKAVVERCKAYQDSEEYLRREEDAQEVAPRKALQQVWWDKTDNSQQSLVKNLREKFQTLNSSS
ncbi:pleckstrin homology domain-containing family G member 3 isoform X5 [Sceloporus undulatus]|uniref:pleckstrin homology domain-containing family G member 3 isoform X5 n=1 Tax=Sceloporus undulatus TaxID=8520 RepID=UPI001C4C4EC2|nr:pleckstrin homology domain-containing family G member 3 isoform X5 [Sceloporus undulatus]